MNKLLDAVTVALSSVWSNKLRSLMMILGNVVAVTSIIAVVSLIRGMDTYVASAIIGEVGAGTFRVERVGFVTDEEEAERAWRRNPVVTMADLRAIATYSDRIDTVMAESSGPANLSFGDETIENARIRGVSADYAEFSGYIPALGRIPTRQEVQRARQVALLGWNTAENLFKGRYPIDRVIRIRAMHFRVIGVAEKKGSVFGESQDEFVVIPLGAFQKLFGSRRSLELTVKPSDPALLTAAMDDARMALRVKRHLRPKDDDNFGMLTSDTLIDFWRNFSREIGLRKALGARRRDIIWQILTESTTLSVTGGLIGTALGFALAFGVEAFTPLPAAVETWAVALGIGMTATVGLFFGLYPAMRAAALDPIEALRRE